MTDWNWFFSSLAQSVAAIVGVLAAFMIARLLNSQAQFAQNAARTDELLTGAERLRDAAAIRYFPWYNARTNEDATSRAIRSMNEELSAEERYQKAGFSRYTAREDALRAIADSIAEAKAIEAARERRERTGAFGLTQAMLNIPSMKDVMASSAVDQQRLEEGDEIQRLGVEIKHHIRQVEGHLVRLNGNPERSAVVTASLGACALLFYIGVIYPLSFLPIQSGGGFNLSIEAFFEILGSLRGSLLAIVAIVFSGLLLVLYRANEALRHDETRLTRLNEAISLGWYSKYFQVAAENDAANFAARSNAPEN